MASSAMSINLTLCLLLFIFCSTSVFSFHFNSTLANNNHRFMARDSESSADPNEPDVSEMLGGLNAEQGKAFFEIMFNPNVTKAEQKQQLARWAQANGVQSQYANFTQQMQQKFAQLESAAQQNLQGPALNIFNQLATIHKDETITRRLECQRIYELFNADSTDEIVLSFVPKQCVMAECSMEMLGGTGVGESADGDAAESIDGGTNDEDSVEKKK